MTRSRPAASPPPAAVAAPRFRRKPLSLAIAAVFAGLPIGLVQAQEAATAPTAAVPENTVDSVALPVVPVQAKPAPRVASDVVLENVTVTATRRDAGVQDIPLNITAITGADIARQGLTDLADLAQTVPGLFLVDQGGRDGNRLVVRGLNVSSLAAGEALGNGSGDVVSTYIGDIPLYLDLKLMDMDRVEALLGPQGTLYGAGTLGGAIRYIPNRPSTAKTSLTLSQDTYGLSRSANVGSETTLVGNLPLSDKAAVRASIGYFRGPGYTDYDFLVRQPGVSDPEPDFTDPMAIAANLTGKEDADSENTLAGRFGLLYEFSETLSANLSYFYQDQSIGGRSVNHQDAIGTGRYVSAHRFLEPNDRKNQLLSLEVGWDLGFASLTSATGLSRYTELGQRDQTDLLLDFEYGYEDFPAFAAFTRETQEEERVSQEIRLVSTGDGPWNWIVGGFYNRAKTDATSSEFTPGFPEFAGIDRPDNLEYFQTADETFTEMAAFGELGYRLTPAWQVTVGARVFEFEDKLKQGIAFPLVDGSMPDEVLPEFQQNDISDGDAIFKFNTAYQFNQDLLGYVTISEGYRSGGVNPLPNCPDPLPDNQFACVQPNEALIKPDSTLNHEVGVHSTWLDGRLIVNGSLYYIDWQDVQVAGSTEIGSVPITVNGAQAKSQGVELAARGLLTKRWRIQANYSYNRSELTEDAPGIVGGEDAFKGDRLPGSPKHQGSLLVGYTRPLPNGWIGSADYGFRAVSDVLSKPGSRDNGESLPGYVVHKAALSASTRQWTARLYAENLFDRYVETGVRDDRGALRAVEGDGDTDNGDGFKLRRYYKDVLEPLRVGLSFRYDFTP